MLIAPTEPPSLRAIGTVSSTPELFGVDVLFYARGLKYGIQRKEIKDLLASIEDGRLAKEIGMMAGRIDVPVLMVEGELRFTMDGVLTNGSGFGREWTKTALRGLLWSARAKGLWVQHTDNLADTIATVQMLQLWAKKDRHGTLEKRPGVQSVWGRGHVMDREYGVYVLQSLPGVGSELAGRIWDKYGLCMELTVGEGELMAVEGIGKKKAQAMIQTLGPKGHKNGADNG